MKQVIHIHNPRTAGMSMRIWARRRFSPYQSLYRFGTAYKADGLWQPSFDPAIMWTYLGHSLAVDLMKGGIFDQEWYDSCFKFVFVRNTWTRMVSHFEQERAYRIRRHRKRMESYLRSFEAYVDYVVSLAASYRHNNKQLVWLQSGVDFIGRFENIEKDWERLCKLVGVKYTSLLHANVVPRKIDQRFVKPGGWRGFYTKKTRRIVANFYAEEIEHFGFSY